MPNINLSMLNQKATPSFYADTLANRPAPSYVGRIFVSTDTLDLYRDTGTAWVLLSPSSTGTITGSGAAGQVTIFSGASSITGTNNLFWDTSNLRLGINTNTPGASLDVHSAASSIAQFNQTTATNDTRIAFQNSGVAKWRIGSFYNLGSNDYAVNDATLNINRFTIKSSSGQTFVGDETTSSGLFVVNNSSADAHLVVLGATAPSLRVRNAGVGASLQFGLGLATTTNNFIQGATGGEFCIFNDSLTAQPILFGIKDAGLGNTQEAARISAARNFLVGVTTDGGQKLQVNGTSYIDGAAFFNSTLETRGNIRTLISTTTGVPTIYTENNVGSITQIRTFGTSAPGTLFGITRAGYSSIDSNNGLGLLYGTTDNSPIIFGTNNVERLRISNAGYSTFTNGITCKDSMSVIDIGTSTKYLQFAVSNTLAEIYTNYTNTNIPLRIQSYGNNNQLYLNTTGNVLLGTSTDAGQKLQVNGSTYVSTDILIGRNTYFSFFGDSNGIVQYGTGTIYVAASNTEALGLSRIGTDGNVAIFRRSTTTVGSISVDSTNTTYNTSSDYRLKEDLKDFNGLSLINSIKTYDFKWKLNNKRMFGVLAHELQSILPYAVIGEKDGKDSQGVDYSKIVPLLVKAIQELNTKIENLK